MKIFTRCQDSCFRRLFNINILSGLAIAAIAFVLMISGDYANIAERQRWDAVYNLVILGSLLYAIIFWYLNTFFRSLLVRNRQN